MLKSRSVVEELRRLYNRGGADATAPSIAQRTLNLKGEVDETPRLTVVDDADDADEV